MCYSCGEHVTQQLWYLEPEKHRTLRKGFLPKIIERYMNEMVEGGLKKVASKQPYGADRWTGISRSLWDWFAKSIHGFQVVPDLESTLRVIDMANEVSLSPCHCREMLNPDQDNPWKCLGLNYSAKIAYQRTPQRTRLISKGEAKDIIASQREEKCFQSVGWMFDANVSWICNCDEFCASHRTVELEWALIPSFFVSHLIKPEACDGCQICTQVCHCQGAVKFNEEGTFLSDEDHETLCRGCGLCVEHCPTGALGLVPRRTYWDVSTKRKTTLPKGELSI